MFGSTPLEIIARLPALLIGVVCHEGAHALAADRLGDPTPQKDGRLSLDPRVHFSSLGALFILLAPVGWGKSVSFNPAKFYSPLRGTAKVAFAGPLASLVVATITSILHFLLFRVAPPANTNMLSLVLRNIMFFNLFLAFFNLLPFGPFDGNKVLAVLSPKMAKKFAKITFSSCGFLLLIFFFFHELLQLLFLPVVLFVQLLVTGGLALNLFVLTFVSLTVYLFCRSFPKEGEGEDRKLSFAISFRKLLSISSVFLGVVLLYFSYQSWRLNTEKTKSFELLQKNGISGTARITQKTADGLVVSIYQKGIGNVEEFISAQSVAHLLKAGDETEVIYTVDGSGRPTNIRLKLEFTKEPPIGYLFLFLLGFHLPLLAKFLIWPGKNAHFGQAQVLDDGVTIQGEFRVLSINESSSEKS